MRSRFLVTGLVWVGAGLLPVTVAQGQTTRPAYASAFHDLYEHVGQRYPGFKLKGIDWAKVGEELLPQATKVRTDEEFGLLCMQLVARLEDSHAALMPGTAKVPQPPLPLWGPGVACLLDDQDRLVVFHVDPRGSAAKAGIQVGMVVVSVDSQPAADALQDWMRLQRAYVGYSSARALRYDAARMFLRRQKQGETLRVAVSDLAGKAQVFRLTSDLGVGYIPRAPVPIAGIPDSRDYSWKRLSGDIGYLRVRRIRGDLPGALDKAVAELQSVRGLIIDVRGNSGGGFESDRAYRNFDGNDGQEPLRPRYTGPMAVLIDERCISAGEGWASWFVARKRARLYGSATAGASSAKETYTLTNGLFKVLLPVRFRTGALQRIIERRGLEPDVPVRQQAADLVAGRDTVLEAARQDLLAATQPAR